MLNIYKLGDGLFDKFKNKELIRSIWERMNLSINYKSLHEMTGDISGFVINEVLNRETTDNLTVVVISLNGLKCHFSNTEIIYNTAKTAQQVNKIPKPIISNKNNLKEIDSKSIIQSFNTKNKSSSSSKLVINNICT